jgi:hypothetical protein
MAPFHYATPHFSGYPALIKIQQNRTIGYRQIYEIAKSYLNTTKFKEPF